MHRPRTLVAVLSALLAAVGLTSVLPATATADPVTETVTVFLKAPNPTGLAQLAQARGLSRAQRLSALAGLVPSDATHAAVAQSLRDRGFRIVGETAWSITAAGPQLVSHALFGPPRTAAAPTPAARARAASSPLPHVPAVLSPAVAAVFPAKTGTSLYHHAVLDGTGFRNAYTPARKAPSTGQKDAPATIATIQLADFKDADLTRYANDHKIPLASGQYKRVLVDGGPTAADDNSGGDIEVALDQESILSTAPTANQQAYFASGTSPSGFNDAFSSVYDDVVGNRYATTPNRHIVALSSSWGLCENWTGYQAIHTLEPILQSLVAAGVTVFSAAGDTGIYDCFDPSIGQTSLADVDYPGSSPEVLSVGGSYLSSASNQPNTGGNWTETGWNCQGAYDCEYGNGGSGGGKSGEAYRSGYSDSFGGFAAPAYQTAGIDNAPFRNNAKRLVPDLTADGSWRTGFRIYTSDLGNCNCHNPVVGGTSLSTPVSAALLTNALADAGHTTGVGDIHGALYSAYRRTHTLAANSPARAVRDITSGQNGSQADRAGDPSVYAARGYDTVSGVGAVFWPAVLPYVFNNNNPVVGSVKFAEPQPYTSAWRHITASWTARQGADPRLLGPSHMVVQRLGAGAPAADYYVYPASNSRSFTGVPGTTYRVTVQARDIGRHQSGPSSALVRVPLDDSWFTYGAKWQRVTRAGDIGGSHLNTAVRGAYLTAGGYGSSYQLRVRVGPDGGRLGVAAGGTHLTTINLYARSAGTKTVTIPIRQQGRMQRTFTFTDLDNKRVSVDALWVSY